MRNAFAQATAEALDEVALALAEMIIPASLAGVAKTAHMHHLITQLRIAHRNVVAMDAELGAEVMARAQHQQELRRLAEELRAGPDAALAIATLLDQLAIAVPI